MNHQTEIQDLIRWSVNKMEHLGWRKVIESNLIARLRGGLGGSHTVVTYPPLDALEPILPDQVISRSGPVSGLDLYLHIPFCEFICPFCHYDTQPTNINKPQEAKIQNYINALHEEVASWKGLIGRSTLNSIYIGGGTPTAISEEQLLSLLDSVSSLPRKQNFVGCVETSPLTVTAAVGRRKLQSLLNKGINRLSMGVQSFNSELLRCSRGYDLKTVLKSLEIVQALIDNLNIDLIQDLPNQTDEDLLTDLEYVDKIKPAQVTWYIMRLRPESRWYRRYQGSSLNISESSQSIRRTLMIRQGMERIGYLAMPGGRFIRERRYRDTFKDSRAGLNSVLLGCGLSAYSHGWDYIFRN
ncbi:MAG TPA: radical SAM protein, partial [Blastocatellia bacterium]|nr:radical SAM protein [Blastocatellia bacterium]